MDIAMYLYIAILFVVLSPSVLFKFPTKGSLLVTAIFHGIVFFIVYNMTHSLFWPVSEGFRSANKCAQDSDCVNSGKFCNSNTETCTFYKSLVKGDYCDRKDVCINGCDMKRNMCF